LYGANLQLVGANAKITKYLFRRGRFNEAETLVKEVIKSYETELGCEHSNTPRSMNSLATVYCSQGWYNAAEALAKRALALQEKHLGTDHADMLRSMDTLATAYELQGRSDDAETLYKQTLALRSSIWELITPTHSSRSTTLLLFIFHRDSTTTLRH
jgi:tetratricopeptide (TPR) repeat protein